MAEDDDSNWAKYASYGFEAFAGVGIGALVGNWLDKRHGWTPWGTLIGCCIGLAGGMYLMIRDALRMNKD